MRIAKRPLPVPRRARNFRHLLRYPEDRARLPRESLHRFLHTYAERSGLTPRQTVRFMRLVQFQNPEIAWT